MKIALHCSELSKGILLELFSARNITIDPQSAVSVVETGYEIPTGKIAIVFHMAHLAMLVELLDKMANGAADHPGTVIGRNIHESYEIVPLEQVQHFEARGNYVFCVTASQAYRVKEKLFELESRLPRNRFIRVGKSHIVNINHVKEIIPWFGRRFVLKFIHSKQEIEVSKNYVKSLKEFLGI